MNDSFKSGLCFLILALTHELSVAQTFTNYTTSDGVLSNNVNCLSIDASDNIWFGTQAGVSFFDDILFTSYTTTSHPGLADNNVVAIYVANDGTIWAGTDFGLSYYNGTSWATYTTTDGLGDDRVKCITEDASGTIWIGTNDGVTSFDGSLWTSWGVSEGLPFGGVTHIEVHNSGNIYMGSGLGGVLVYNGSTFNIITEAEGLVNDKVRSIVFDASDNKWVGTASGISVLNTSDVVSGSHTQIFQLPPPDTLNPVEDVAIDSNGNIWAAIYVDYLVTEGGVSMYNGSYWRSYDVSDGLIGPVVKQMAVDASNDLWITTSLGVSKMSGIPSGLDEMRINTLNVYPNPSNQWLNVTVNQNTKLTVFDTEGRILFSEQGSGTVQKIDVSQWACGIYVVSAGGINKRVVVTN